jgi:hypothetical protein
MDVATTTAPADPQYMLALERANKVALDDIDVAEVILSCPWEAYSMAVSALLTSQRRWGASRCRKVLAMHALSDRKTIGSLTDRQREALAATLIATEPHLPSRARARVEIRC